MQNQMNHIPNPSRRSFFDSVGSGLFAAALSQILGRDLYGSEDPPSGHARRRVHDLKPKPTHHTPRATSVIHLFMNGGPSQMDLFDPKPELDRRHGEDYFDKIAGEVENPTAAGALMRCPYKFAKHGECGMDVSDVMPHLAGCVDDIALIRSMYTVNLTHEPALYKIHSGRQFSGGPSLGAWITYGLGTENQNLPAYVVLDDPLGLPINGVQNWQPGFLPPVYQGTRFRATGSPVLNLKPDYEQPDEIQHLKQDLISRLDRVHLKQRPGNPQLDARIAGYELAARMQLAAGDALDLSQETAATQESYGLNDKTTESYGRRCLIARRLVERGVRFVQLFINAQIFDNHTGLENGLKGACARTDRPIAALLKDLKQRGLLDTTLVVWGGEFGRLPIAQLPADKNPKNAGRDHNKNAMCTWLAGGGIKGGTILGTTDDLGFAAAENRISVQDWHATILHQLGLHHEELFINHAGLRERLTGVFEARVVDEILA